jgi:NADH-quinone oxidoreductase subunit M
VYVLKALKLVLHGPLNEEWAGKIQEINLREIIVVTPLILLILSIGIWPAWIVDLINRAVSSWY